MSEAKFFRQLIRVLEGLKGDSKPRGKLNKTFTSVRVLKPFITNDEKQGKTFNIVPSAVQALWSEIMRGKWTGAASLLVQILNHGRRIEHFAWSIGLHIIWNHPEAQTDHLREFLNVAWKSTLYHPEVRLIGFLHLIGSGLEKEAQNLALKPKSAPKGRRKKLPNNYTEKVEKLLLGYKVAAEYLSRMEYVRDDYEYGAQSARKVFVESAQSLLPCLFEDVAAAPHLFLGMYLQFLRAQEGEAFAKTYALNVSKAREEELAIQATVNSFIGPNRDVLERMVLSSPGDTCAFDLGQILLQGGGNDDSGNEDDDTDSRDLNGKNASRALSVVANGLDFPQNYTSITGWSLFWQAIRKACAIGSRKCAKEVQSVYEDRKSWWNMVHFADGLNEAPDLRLLKASCCYVLESEDHPYVRAALQNNTQKTLQMYINQIKPRKKALDAKRAKENAPGDHAPALFYPDSESDTDTNVSKCKPERLSESEMNLPKSASGMAKHIPSSSDRRFRSELKDCNVYNRLQKRLHLRMERRWAHETTTVVSETDEENFPVTRKRGRRKRKRVTKRKVLKSAVTVDSETEDFDSVPEITSSRKINHGRAASALSSRLMKSENASKEAPFEASRPEAPRKDVFLRPGSEKTSIKLKKAARIRCYSEASSVTSEQDGMSLETSASSTHKEKKKKQSSLSDNSQVSSNEFDSTLETMADNVYATLHVKQESSQVKKSKKSGGAVGETPVEKTESITSEESCISLHERSLILDSVKVDKKNDGKQGPVNASKPSVGPEEDGDHGAYVSSFVRDFSANPTAQKHVKKSAASRVLSCTSTGQQSTGSVTATKKKRRGISNTKVDKASKSQSNKSVQFVPDEDEDYDAYISNFVKNFLATHTAPKRSNK